MKRPYTMEAVFYTINDQIQRLSKRLENFETWEPPQVGMHAYLTSNTVFGAGAGYSDIIFDAALYDSYSTYDTTTGIFTAPVAGRYLVSLNIWQSAPVAATLHLRLQHSTAAYQATQSFDGNFDGLGLSLPVKLAAAETLKVEVDEVGVGTGLAAAGSTTNPYLTYLQIELLTKAL
jgi:hypothetical protein